MNGCYEKYIKDTGITVKYARGPSQLRGKEFHTYHEILFFLSGEAEFISEEINTRIDPGSIVIIPKESYHSFNILSNEESYHRLVFNFSDLPELSPLIKAKMRHTFVGNTNDNLSYLLQKVIRTAESDEANETKTSIVRAVLTLILSEISENRPSKSTRTRSISPKVIEYINQNLCTELSVADIARKMNISQSSLTHRFKGEMNISLHRYIIEKRLVLAHRSIANGESATTVAIECGFNDYSGFYKQYKKMFGIPPSSTSVFDV